MRSRVFFLCMVLSGASLGCDGQPVAPDAGSRPDTGLRCGSNTECDDGLFCTGVERCWPSDPEADDFGCTTSGPPCRAGEVCDEEADRCELDCAEPDADGDGHDRPLCGGDDCDDTDANRFPGNLEVCDASEHDEDCDPETFGDHDLDADGHVDARCCNAPFDDRSPRYCGDDCDDGNRRRYPNAPEVCDGFDNDCNGLVDEDVRVSGFVDLDRDGFGNTVTNALGCPGETGFSTVGGDCNDTVRGVFPGAPEICDGRDDDCDGRVDEHAVDVPWYADEDGDGYGDPGSTPVHACEPPLDRSRDATDCDDADLSRHQAADELCNAIDDDCDGVPNFEITRGDYEDDDGDGFADMACGGDDCDDTDPLRAPGLPELLDGRDNDCDDEIDEDAGSATFYRDADGDGFGDPASTMSAERAPAGYVARAGDCDDTSANDYPGAAELCDDDDDDDCDGLVDESTVSRAIYRDADGDGFGDVGMSMAACGLPSGYTLVPGDCADDDDARNPTRAEVCDGLDTDCDGEVDEGVETLYYLDADEDGHGDASHVVSACAPPADHVALGDDCDDADGARFPGATEVCDLDDEDCDAAIDEDAQLAFYRDADLDGFGTPLDTVAACAAPEGYVAANGDCDDACPTCLPGGTEVCDDEDNDCDALFDEGVRVTFYRDRDGDGVGRASEGTLISCSPPGGYVATDGDCDDRDATRGPGFPEACDRLDDDCDDDVDEDVRCLGTGAASTYGWLGATRSMFAWGANPSGQLCVGNTSGPYSAPQPTGRTQLVELSGGAAHACFVDSSGEVYCCGATPGGPTSSSASPIAGLAEVIAVSASSTHTCVLHEGDADNVSCFGDNTSHALGRGTDEGAILGTPAAVVGLAEIRQIAVGDAHGCALGEDGAVFCWGRGADGRLGSGGTSDQPTAAMVPGLSDVVMLAQGGSAARHQCALVADGRVLCWGDNASGQLGDGTLDDALTPVEVTGLDDATFVARGSDFSCAIRESGAVVCWGLGASGQLGDGTITSKSTFVTVAGLSEEAFEVALADAHACARLESNAVLCWGANGDGNLGRGSTMPNPGLTPAAVSGWP